MKLDELHVSANNHQIEPSNAIVLVMYSYGAIVGSALIAIAGPSF